MDVGVPPSLLRALAAAADAPWPPVTAGDCDRLLAHAATAGLLPLLFETPGPPVFHDALQRQQGHRRLAARRCEILLQGLEAVGRALGDEPFVVLKGADYARRLYARPDLRPMQDLDVLVPRARLPHVYARLAEAGATPRALWRIAAHAESAHERPFVLGDVVVEVHQAFVQRARHRVDYDAIWERRVACGPGSAVARLEDTDALVAHAVSLAKDGFSVPLVRYLDLRLLLPRARLDQAAARAREWSTVRVLFGALSQALALMPELRTPEREEFLRELLPRRSRAFLEERVLPPLGEQGRARAVSRGRNLWRKLWLMDDAGRRLSAAAGQALALVTGGVRTFLARWRPAAPAAADPAR
jgi:hypothetical protein